MKAIFYQQYGSPDVLKLKEVDKPIPKDNEVLIKVYASSINSWDWDLLTGKPYLYRLLFGIIKPKLTILGADIAGRVEAIGKNVKQLHPGDEVFGDISGCSWGGFAEYVCASENVLTHKSVHMTFDEAAAIPQAGVLALQALRYKGQLKQGQTVLINGAGGGVGTFALQIAKSFGAEVTCVDSSDKLDLLRSIGADYTIDYTQQDFTKSGKCYDLILDVVAHHSIFDYKRALNPKGTYVMVGGSIRRIFQIAFLGPLISLTSKKMGILMHAPSTNDLKLINEFFETGKVVPVIDRRYPISEVAEALRYFGQGRVKGKIVINTDVNRNANLK